MGAQCLLGLVLNAAQWNAHALNISFNDEGLQVIAQRYATPAYVELDAGIRYVGHGDNHQQSE